MDESSQGGHKAETNFTHGMSRTETINCPSRSFEPCSFKNTTQSYSYSSEDEFERVERHEKEWYERRLIREHLRQKSRDEPHEYCLGSFEYVGRNLADTDETDGWITVSYWSEPETIICCDEFDFRTSKLDTYEDIEVSSQHEYQCDLQCHNEDDNSDPPPISIECRPQSSWSWLTLAVIPQLL